MRSIAVLGVDLSSELALVDSVIPIQVDLTMAEGPMVVRQEVEGLKLPLLGLVNNAGITRDSRLINMTNQQFSAVLDVNLGAAYRLATELTPAMTSGAVVNVASRSYLGAFGQYNYSMSKGGLVGMTRALAHSLAPRIRVNAIAPGLIDTEMSRAIPEDIRNSMTARIPLERMGTPDEIADLVWFLLGPHSSYITGEVIVIAGGRGLK